MEALQTRLKVFAAWVEKYITGDEKGESQIFLERFFQALGHEGLREAGAVLEHRVKKRADGGVAFADLVWKPVVLVEMKRRGTKLAQHYRQAFDYWVRLVPGRPRYVVLCNFDEFWIYDFQTQMDSPVQVLPTSNAWKHPAALAFMQPVPEAPVFENDQEAVTRQAADDLAQTYNSLCDRGIGPEKAQKFTLQTLVALFAQGIYLLPSALFSRTLQDCKRPRDSFDLLGQLFTEMNTPGKTEGGRFAGVEYFNGGLFAKPARIELNAKELELLRHATSYDWSQVSPDIFGTIFEHSLGEEQRHAYGAHFTCADDIMKIVRPTIVEPWTEKIDSAKTLKELQRLAYQLQHFHVLDPACGSGNFLYIAYREVKRIEAKIYAKIAAQSARVNEHQRVLGFVTASNFYGIDINEFSIELAKVTMMIARKLAIDELHITEPTLPLDNLDSNFTIGDALVHPDGRAAQWPPCHVIIGNPPFLGAKRLKPERGDEYVKQVRRAYKGVPGMADYCVFWLRKAHDHLPTCTAENPLVGRAGLVGTQNIRSNKSREGGLDYIVKSGTILEAVDNQPWSGDAAVHVSIVNWAKTTDLKLLKGRRKIWTPVPPETPQVPPRSSTDQRSYDLVFRECAYISSSLSDELDISGAESLECNKKPQRTFQGVTPGYDGFVLGPGERAALVARRPSLASYLPGYLIGRELMTGDGRPQRYLIDLDGLDLVGAKAVGELFRVLDADVLPSVKETYQREVNKNSDMQDARKEHLQRWWTFWARRTELRTWMNAHSRIIAASRTQRFPFVFEFISTKGLLPGDKLQLFAFEDDYSFGILQSSAHAEWFAKKTSRLKNEEDFNYSSKSVFHSFPWPTAPDAKGVRAVASAAVALRTTRRKLQVKHEMGLRDLYATLLVPGKSELRSAQELLDQAVKVAYGFPRNCDLSSELLTLNLEIANGVIEPAPPGVPPHYKGAGLISEDCIKL